MRGIGPSLPTNWPIPLIRYIPRINSNGQLCASNSVHQTATVPNVRDGGTSCFRQRDGGSLAHANDCLAKHCSHAGRMSQL